MSQTNPPQSIPIPPNFPVEWESEDEARLFWMQGQGYYPTPLTPMGFELVHKTTMEAANKRMAELNVPMNAITRHINGYVYNAILPPQPDAAPPPEITEDQLDAMISNLAERWNSTWLPQVKEHLAWWRAFDLRAADAPALLEHLEETEERMKQIEVVHFDTVLALMIAIDRFQKTVEDLFSGDDAVEVHALLAGFESRGTQSSKALWALSRQALADPAVQQILTEAPADEVMSRLKTEEGQAFLTALDDFLDEYGYQGDKNYISEPTLGEDPTMVIQSLQGYLGQPDRDLEADAQAIVAKREQAISDLREKLRHYPQPIKDSFEFLLEAAQKATWLREEHAHQLDLPLNQCLRRVLLEIGKRLHEASAIERPRDVFYLTPQELRITMSTEPFIPRHELVRQRRAMEEKYREIAPPLMFGPIPTEPPPDHPIVGAMMQNVGDPSQSSVAPGEMKGISGSPGTVRGTAKVLHSLSEADKLNPGDILVAATTVPSWTLLFANLGGLVTATGGALSHAAIVAREFGIPAVVGAVGATALIQDGQQIEVDGTNGVVRMDLPALAE